MNIHICHDIDIDIIENVCIYRYIMICMFCMSQYIHECEYEVCQDCAASMLCISSVDINVNMKYVKIARQVCMSLPQDVNNTLDVCMLRLRCKYVVDAAKWTLSSMYVLSAATVQRIAKRIG